MSDVAVILLAAGMSRRMDPRNKLLMHMDNEPILSRVLRVVSPLSTVPVTVVTGHEQLAVICTLGRENVDFVHNPAYASGQMTSVDTGLRMAPMAETTVLALGDQPFLEAQSLQALLHAHQTQANGRITIPFVEGQRGNPIMIPKALRLRMLNAPVNLGCRSLTRNKPELVHRFDSTHRGFVDDVDTPNDLARRRDRPVEAFL